MDDWDTYDEAPTFSNPGVNAGSGQSFSKGRGFSKAPGFGKDNGRDNSNGFGGGKINDGNSRDLWDDADDGSGDGNSFGGSDRRGGGRRGGGRGGGEGGRGNRGGFRGGNRGGGRGGNRDGESDDRGRYGDRGSGFGDEENGDRGRYGDRGNRGGRGFKSEENGERGRYGDREDRGSRDFRDDENGGRGRYGDRGGSRGGGRGRGGGSFNKGNRDDEGDNDFGSFGDDDDSGRDGNRGGRGRGGGRGGGFGDRRGGRGGSNGDGGGFDGDGDGEKKREIYIPPDVSTDENEIFHSGNTSGINFKKYDTIEVKTTGENIPPPIAEFADAGLREIVMENINKSDYGKPTPIQKQSIPIVLNGRDLMACAQTGSGKTAAFLVPIINILLEKPIDLVTDESHVEPQCVIISPTRELAIQIYDEAYKFAFKSVLKIAIAYGGTAVRHQLDRVMRGCHILVATPGRMNDFVKRGNITFNSTRFVVLDEADRMLDMGFLPTVEEVMEHESMVPTADRQTLMFSATFPEDIQRLAGKFLNNYIFVAVGIVGGACTDVEQTFYQVDRFNKRNKLMEILKECGTERTLVFVETKRSADFLATFLSEGDLPTTSIHGDRLQREREDALRDFKRGNRHILVATGVAARGLDIKNVHHVINFDLPNNIDEYVHRIGRTGRVGNRGKATSFYDGKQDHALASALARILKQAGQPVPDWMSSAGGDSSHGGGSSAFGGTDFRDDNFATSNNAATADEPDVDWA